MSDWLVSLLGSLDPAHAAALWRAAAVGVLGLMLSALYARFKDKGAAGVIDLSRWLALLFALETLRPLMLTGYMDSLALTVEGLFA